MHVWGITKHSINPDCGNPTTPGYSFGSPAPNNEYLSTVDVTSCATGYEGTPSPVSLQCEASGSWTTVTGCTKKGKTTFITVIINGI